MSISADTLLERIKLKGALRRWRAIAIFAVTMLLLSLVGAQMDTLPGQDYIARLVVKDIIEIDRDRMEAIEKIGEDDSIKAVILEIDSPGGTAAGGESLYYSLQELRKKKPVVAVMGNLAASAGYLIATPVDRIFAHKATLTGSIGVILQSPNVAALAEKVGVKMDFIKTGPLKGAPNMFEQMTPEAEKVMQSLVDDFYDVFVDIIVENRKLDKKTVQALADGRVYSGRQAVKNGLVDEIGTEKTALEWLKNNKNIEGLKVVEFKYGKRANPLEEYMNVFSGKSLLPKEFSMYGLLSMWNNAVIK